MDELNDKFREIDENLSRRGKLLRAEACRRAKDWPGVITNLEPIRCGDGAQAMALYAVGSARSKRWEKAREWAERAERAGEDGFDPDFDPMDLAEAFALLGAAHLGTSDDPGHWTTSAVKWCRAGLEGKAGGDLYAALERAEEALAPVDEDPTVQALIREFTK